MTPPIIPLLSSVKQTSSGWQAKCPAHEDKRASLSITLGNDGRTLLHCHAGCTPESIVSKLGMRMNDLFPPKPSKAERVGPGQRLHIVTTYDYTDENGDLLYQVCRLDPKDFRQRRSDGKGGWTWKVGNVRRVLYRLGRVVEAVRTGETVVIVEGEKDVENLERLGFTATTNAGGAGKWVSGYSETLRGAAVVILPDNDDPGDNHARKVAESLHAVGVRIRIVKLPDLPPKGDVSDWIAAGGTAEQLRALIGQAEFWTPPVGKAKEAPTDDDAFPIPYEETKNGIVWVKPVTLPDGGQQHIRKPLTNFTARIVRQVWSVDDVADRLTLEIEATRAEYTRRFEIEAKDFTKMDWPCEHIGAEAAVFPGSSLKDHARFAVQMLSGEIPRHIVYKHLGWRRIGDRWVYLHAGGAVGAEGVSVHPEGLENYVLPIPPASEAARAAVVRSLKFLDIAPRNQTWPLLAAAHAAPLAEAVETDFLVWVRGVTGSRKSTVAALVLNHFGTFGRNRLPANFTSTANQLEALAFAAKDALFVVDDYAPASDAKKAAAQETSAHNFIRAVGDRRGRGRMQSDTSLRKTKFPRCLTVVTSELPAPGHQSSQARCFEVAWPRDGVDLDRLTDAQRHDAPMYSSAMAGYVAWLADRYDAVRDEAPEWVRRTALEFKANHGRIPEACAKLLFGVRLFLDYAVGIEAVTPDERDTFFTEARDALAECGDATNEAQEWRKPTTMFFELLDTMLAQGAVYLADRETGESPPDAARWGWRRYFENALEGFRVKDAASLVGWVDAEEGDVFLLPSAVLKEVHQFTQKLHQRFPADVRAMGEHLEQDGHLKRTEERRSTLRIRANNSLQRVWQIKIESFDKNRGQKFENAENRGNSGNKIEKPHKNPEESNGCTVPASVPAAFPQDVLREQKMCDRGPSRGNTAVTPREQRKPNQEKNLSGIVTAVTAVTAKNTRLENFSREKHVSDADDQPTKRRKGRV